MKLNHTAFAACILGPAPSGRLPIFVRQREYDYELRQGGAYR